MLFLLPHAIDRAADRSGEREAVRCDGRGMTYGDLVERSNRLAHLLVAEGVKRGDRVGIHMPKCLEAAVAIYGIMKAGAAYVPLDPRAPPARLSYVLGDCGIRHLIAKATNREMLHQIAAASETLECVIDADPRGDLPLRTVPWEALDEAPGGTPPDVGTIEQDLAYVLYTSGSTGDPKGIMHTHRSGLAFAEVAARTYGFTEHDRLSNHAPLHFDLSTLDYFSAAVSGATTVIIPEEYTKFPASLSKLMADERLTVLYVVPLVLIQLLLAGALDSRDLGALRWVLFGGEPMPTKHLRELMRRLPGARFCNVYGPTETNGCTYYLVPPLPDDMTEAIPIGRPYENVETLVASADDRPIAPGETGELLVRGASVMRGYWGRPDLTERGFYRRPVLGGGEDVFHRTGDLVQLRSDGDFSFLGRKDRQIKTRGHRVELDEVEAVLLAHDDVKEAAVFAVPDGEASRKIEAAVITRPESPVDAADLTRHAAGRLARYAVPTRFEIVDSFPRTSTGKIDRRRLQTAAEQGVGL